MIRNWFDRWFRARRRPIRNNPASSNRARLSGFQTLEDRTVPSSTPVNGIEVWDLTAVASTATVNTAIFNQVSPQPTGTGVIDPFVRIQRSPSNPSGMEHGYNTDGVEEFDTKDAGGHNWDHSLLLSSLVEVNGYYQFTLDINETKPGTLLSLDELQVFVQGKGDLTGAKFDANGTITKFGTTNANLVYDMDGGPKGDSSVMLNYFLNHGSGSGDMTVLIPKSLFPDVRGKQYVYLYSKFGQYSGNSAYQDTDPPYANLAGAGAEAGFEEWTALVKKGQVGPFSISGKKYNDVNGDGNIVGDPTLSGWTISLYRESNNQAGLQVGAGGDTFISAQVTGSDGAYSFGNLTAGATYYTAETLKDGWIQTYGGNTDNGDNDYYTTVLNSDAPDLDFGNFNLIDLTGVKYIDKDGDGVIEEGDRPAVGETFTIELYKWADNGDGVVQDNELTFIKSTETSALDGTFVFTGLAPLGVGEKYLVREADKAGWLQTGGGTAEGDYIVDPTSGNDQTGVNFANFELFDISGVKYRDIDRDGVKDSNEPLLSGWTINLYYDANENGILDDAVLKTTVTGDGGAYSFTDLGPGTYFVREVLKDNWEQISLNPAPITGSSGETFGDVDFGNAMIEGGVGRTKGFWHNQNGNAIIQNQLGGWDHVADVLATLNLRDINGNLFFATDRTIEEFNDYLTSDSNASNMVTQLSVQLAAAYLNAWAGSLGLSQEGQPFASFDTLLQVSTSISANGYITVGELIDQAVLALHGNDGVGDPLADYDLIDPSAARTYANLLMTALDKFNNSLNILDA